MILLNMNLSLHSSAGAVANTTPPGDIYHPATECVEEILTSLLE